MGIRRQNVDSFLDIAIKRIKNAREAELNLIETQQKRSLETGILIQKEHNLKHTIPKQHHHYLEVEEKDFFIVAKDPLKMGILDMDNLVEFLRKFVKGCKPQDLNRRVAFKGGKKASAMPTVNMKTPEIEISKKDPSVIVIHRESTHVDLNKRQLKDRLKRYLHVTGMRKEKIWKVTGTRESYIEIVNAGDGV